MGFPSTRILIGLVLLTLVAILVCQASRSVEGFEEGADAADALVFRVYMDVYGVPPDQETLDRYKDIVHTTGIGEDELRGMLQADEDSAPASGEAEEDVVLDDTDMSMVDMPGDNDDHDEDMEAEDDAMDPEDDEEDVIEGFNPNENFDLSTGGAFANSRIEFGPGTRVVDCDGGKCGKGTNLVLHDSNGGPNQQWSYDPKSRRATSMGHCLDVYQGGKGNGTKVWSYECNGGKAQEWVVQKNQGPGTGDVQLMNPNSGKCLDVRGGKDANRAPIQLWDCKTSANGWEIREPFSPGTGWAPIAGKLLQLSLGGKNVIGINRAHDIFVAPVGTSKWAKKSGKIQHITLWEDKVCGINKANDIYFADNVLDPKWKRVNGKLDQVCMTDGGLVAGVTKDHEVYVGKFGSGEWTKKPGVLKYISVDGKRACGTNAADDVFCAEDVNNPKWVRVPGKLSRVELSGTRMCGVNSAGNVYMGTFMRGNWDHIASGCFHADILKDTVYICSKEELIFVKKFAFGSPPAEGSAVRCSRSNPVKGGIFRYTDGKLRHYPNPHVAASWDSNWARAKTIDCTGIATGPKMEVKPAPLPAHYKPLKKGDRVKGDLEKPSTRSSTDCAARCDQLGSKCVGFSHDPQTNRCYPKGGAGLDANYTSNGYQFYTNTQRTAPTSELTDEQARCYLAKYPDLQKAFKGDLNEAKKHWREFGKKEERTYECPTPIVKPKEGTAVRCTKSSPVKGGIFRYTGGKLRHYPNPKVAVSWDRQWSEPTNIDCTGIPSGPAMGMRKAAPKKKIVEKPAKKVTKVSKTKPSAVVKRDPQTCQCNVNVSPSQTCKTDNRCPRCALPQMQMHRPATAVEKLKMKAHELSGMVTPASAHQQSLGIRLQTLADQVSSLSSEYNGLPQGGTDPIGIESSIMF